jgi:APA family basic amino acid/polyamine antiporter
MIVMGGIIGSGIFVTPNSVAQLVHHPWAILAAWGIGGLIALLGAFIYAELAATRDGGGGQYAYLRDAYHPLLAFLYGWVLLLVIQTGGMAAVAITFARHFLQIVALPLGEPTVAVLAVGVLVAVNLIGVKAGSGFQNTFMLLKIGALAGLIITGVLLAPREATAGVSQEIVPPLSVALLGAAIIPVMFSYGGWQTASFVSGEMRNSRRDLARGVIFGVIGVVLLYLAVNIALLKGLGAAGLARSGTPAVDLMREVFGEPGARFIAMGITISTLGFLSQGMLTAPRVYHAMAADGLFFRQLSVVSPRTRVPSAAIVLQGILTAVIAVSGTFESILNYVVSIDIIFFGLTAGALFVFRRRRVSGNGDGQRHAVPGHPWTTALFIVASAAIVVNTFATAPANSGIGLLLLLAGVPAYFLWSRRSPSGASPG